MCQCVTTAALSQGRYSSAWLSCFFGRTVHGELQQAVVFLDLLWDLKRHERLISWKVKVISHNVSADHYCYSYWNWKVFLCMALVPFFTCSDYQNPLSSSAWCSAWAKFFPPSFTRGTEVTTLMLVKLPWVYSVICNSRTMALCC